MRTPAQRSWLERLAKGPLPILDVSAGSSKKCLSKLEDAGLVRYVKAKEWRNGHYQITKAGRTALCSLSQTTSKP